MNILFVNYGNFTTNSLNHIAGFAARLQQTGHCCAVAVPSDLESVKAISRPHFKAVTYAEVLADPTIFPNGRAADIIHAWTPREKVRRFVLAHQCVSPARVVIHLEDNEEYLLTAFTQRPLAELRMLADDDIVASLDEALPHPLRYRNFLRVVDGVTIITERLEEFVPTKLPLTLLPPGVDFSLYNAPAADPALRRILGLRDDERIITFTGSTTFANQGQMRDLVEAVHLLNQRGTKTRLLRTGFHPEEYYKSCDFDWRCFTLDLGFIEKYRLPALLALADVLVQPGHPGAFDNYRLPSKLPEFLASGRPVILPAANIASQLLDQHDALIMQTGTPLEIADLCQRIFTDPPLSTQLAANAISFARHYFDLETNTDKLATFYQTIANSPSRASWADLAIHSTESVLIPDILHAEIEHILPENDSRRASIKATLKDLTLALQHGEEQLSRGPARRLLDQLQAEISRLSTRIELGANHATNLENSLDTTQRALTTAQSEFARVLHANCLYQGELIRARNEASDQQAWRDALIHNLQFKIQRQQATFSWHLTAPLRFLRRKLLDPFRSTEPPPLIKPSPSLETGPVLDQGYIFHIDEPAHWIVPEGLVTITGWCVGPNREPARNVRARVGKFTFLSEPGFARPDLALRYQSDEAANSGFRILLQLAAGAQTVYFEIDGADHQWHLVAAPYVQTFVQHKYPLAPARTYSDWITQYEKLSPNQLADLSDKIAKLSHRPLISVLMPVFNPPEKWLRQAISSVRTQLYQDWELCISDDHSTNPAVRLLLEEVVREDPRVKVNFRTANGHISAASNSALEIATGDFIALLDHDDELARNALAEVALTLNAHPEADLLYSDEDKIDETGRRFSPYFKPDFLPDLFLGQHYLTHLCVYRTSLMHQAQGFRIGFEGSQDWDLALRMSELTSPDRIIHIPKILYHWRAIPGSTALALDQKDYPLKTARQAVSDHLQRLGQAATLIPVAGGHWRVKYPLPDNPPLVSIIIPTRNGLTLLRRCLESIFTQTTYSNYEILIIDNDSDDPGTLVYLQELSQRGVRVWPYPHPFSYSAINNFAVTKSRGELLAFLNNDIEVLTPDWLEEMVAQALRPSIGAVGAMLYYPNDTIQHAGVVLGIGGVAGHAFKQFPRGTEGVFNRARLVQNYSAVTAACLVIRKTLFNQVGGFDESSLSVAFNDVDFCLKVRATGVWNLWTPFAEFYHNESATRGTENTPAKQVRFQQEVETMLTRWGQVLHSDPAYNPNLSLESEDFALGFPPVSIGNITAKS